MFWKGIVEEFVIFYDEERPIQKLSEKGIHIWDKKYFFRFFERPIIYIYAKEGEMGLMYGHQWRRFNGEHGLDQLSNIIQTIKKEPHSRRL